MRCLKVKLARIFISILRGCRLASTWRSWSWKDGDDMKRRREMVETRDREGRSSKLAVLFTENSS